MKNSKVKLITFICILLVSFLIYLFIAFKSYNYKTEYIIDKFKVLEMYNKKENYYTFYIKDKDNIEYFYKIKHKYIRNRELINKVEFIESEQEICILPKSEKLEFYPLCNNEKEMYTYNNSNINDKNFYQYKKINVLNKEFNKIMLNYLNEQSFLLYNYKGFYLINNNQTKEIELFNKDIYSLTLVYQKDNYIILPDYNKDYYFNKFIIINVKNGKIKEIETEYDISFDSVFLGDYKDKIYILDKKEEKEYSINIKKAKIEKVDFQILKDDKLISTTYKNIINNDLKFDNKKTHNYIIENNTLYLISNNNKIKITSKSVDEIIKVEDETIYYMCAENLYMYNNKYGEVLMLTNFEWNFNNTNMIYLYK